MRTLIALLLLTNTAAAQVVIISENFSRPPAASVESPSTPGEPRPAVFLTSKTVCADGYCWEYSNGGKINETFAAFVERTGKQPPEATRLSCSSGYCGTAAKSPTLATGGCRCGCSAESCNCHHAPNAGKPLDQQRVEPGKVEVELIPSAEQRYIRRGQQSYTLRGLFRRFR